MEAYYVSSRIFDEGAKIIARPSIADNYTRERAYLDAKEIKKFLGHLPDWTRECLEEMIVNQGTVSK